MHLRTLRLLSMALAVLFTATSLAHAQSSGAASLSGVVTDTGGGVIPGATVVVKNDATGVTSETTTSSTGAFSVPALDPGTYTVTISLTGFKTAVITGVRLVTATPQSIKATLEVGALTETVEVRGASALVQTQSTAVQSTISTEQIKELPLVSRNALYFVQFLPGVETAGGPRGSTISGLPNNTINITLDGISVGNQLQSTDGFFSMVTPRLDAVEEITVTGATPGAGGGSGAVQIAFTTRSGTNEFNTSLYHSFRHPSLNSNYFFNKVNELDKNEVIVHQYGGRVGGPIVTNKAFFFFNFEHLYQPSEATRTRTILNPTAQQGIFTYTSGGTTNQVNLLALAAANGHTATADPTIASLLAKIRAATETTGTVSTPVGATNVQDFVYQAAATNNQYAPTTRLDFNVTDNHRLSGTYYWQRFLSKPDLLNTAEPPFPGFSNQGFQTSYRTTGSVGLRSTLKPTMVNELKGGWQWSPNNFFGNLSPDMLSDMNGYFLNFPLITDPAFENFAAPRNTWNWSVENTLNWQKGSHSIGFGGSFQQVTHIQNNDQIAPEIEFGVDTNGNDPANAMFNTTNFPGASTAQLTQARQIYSILTGRITQIEADATLDAATGKYVYHGNLLQKSRMSSFDVYAQDQWRVTPTVTLNYGLRWDLQLPFIGLTDTWSTATLADLCGASGVGSGPGGRECNLFQPGNMPAGAGFVPQYQPFTSGSKGFNTDWNNFAPNGGIAWRPNVQGGWLRTLLGDPEQATFRAGYAMTFGLERMDRFTGLYGSNPGGSTEATRNYGSGFPLGAGPVLFREPGRLGPPAFAEAPNYPIAATIADEVNIFDANLATPYVHSFSAGFQRSLGRDTAVEVRYVGNRNMNAWTTEDWNELVLFENGFMDEFMRAQANLRANIAAGNGGTFAYTGAPGTAPLPTYLAYFSGSTNANDPAAYSSANFRNSAWTGHLGQYEPDPQDAANDLHASATFRGNALRAGLPANFFVMNPAVDEANITKSLAGSRYHSLQMELRRRLSKGLLVNANYTFSRSFGSQLETLRMDRFYLENTDVPHSFKVNWLYELPFGRGRQFGAGVNRWVDAVLGNWQFSGTGRLQKNQYSIQNTRLVGMTEDELQDVFKIRHQRSSTGTLTIFSFPEDIVLNTRRAYNTSPTSETGYSTDGVPTGRYLAPASVPGCVAVYTGDCGSPRQITLNGPLFTRFDMRLNKRFPFGRKASVEVTFEVLNVFDNINYNHVFTQPTATSNLDNLYRVTSAYTDINTTYDPGGRIGHLMWRINF